MSTPNAFTVTCPSNSNMDKYPKNVGSDYTVALANPLNFSGQTLNDDTRWQVSMLSLHYTHNFFNFRETCVLRFVMQKPTELNTSEAASADCRTTDDDNIDWNDMMDDDPATSKALTEHTRGHEVRVVSSTPGVTAISSGTTELFGMIEVPKGYYASIPALCEDITSRFNKVFTPRYKLKLTVTRQRDGCLTFSLSNGGRISVFANRPYIAKVLGLPQTEIKGTKDDLRQLRDVVLQKLTLVGTQVPRLNNVHALYVYADIVEYQHVGDVMAPLIAYVDITKSLGERVGHICNPPVYLPVDRSYIDMIKIRITDEHGENVMFPDDVENVVVRLHFRKAKSFGLF